MILLSATDRATISDDKAATRSVVRQRREAQDRRAADGRGAGVALRGRALEGRVDGVRLCRLGRAKLGTVGAALSNMEAMVAFARAVRRRAARVGRRPARLPKALSKAGSAPHFESCCPAARLWRSRGGPGAFQSSDAHAKRMLEVRSRRRGVACSNTATRNPQLLATQRHIAINTAIAATASACNLVSLAQAFATNHCSVIIALRHITRIATSRCIVLSSIDTSRHDATDCDKSPHKHSYRSRQDACLQRHRAAARSERHDLDAAAHDDDGDANHNAAHPHVRGDRKKSSLERERSASRRRAPRPAGPEAQLPELVCSFSGGRAPQA